MHWIALRPTPDASAAAEPALADAYTALGWWALRFTPLVARLDDALLLEVSGSERLFGGRQALLQQILKPNMPLGLVEYSRGATSLIALARLLGAADGLAGAQPDALPVHTLLAARAHLPTLARLGVRTWGQLRALPRGGLVRRFGVGLVDALDRAYGQQPEVYPWLRLPEVFDMPLELAASVESAPALLFGARRLLAQLQVWLRARQRGVLALELVWNLDPRRANTRHVDAHHTGGQQGRLEWRTAQATQDMAHLQRILGEQLARVTLPAPVLTLRLRSVQTQPLAGESRSLLPDDVRKGDSLHQTLERLGARLGPGQVQCVSPHADHRPERMQQWAPWKASGTAQFAPKKGATNLISERATAQNSAEVHPQAGVWPTWLLPSPQRLPVHGNCPQYQGALTLLVGPQRLEAGWLDGAPVLRDYYIARSPQAGLVWVYRERLGGGAAEAGQDLPWYLHGLYG